MILILRRWRWLHHCWVFFAVISCSPNPSNGERAMPKQRAPRLNQSWAAAMEDSQQRWRLGDHSTSKDFVCEVPWPSQQRLCSAQPFAGGVWEKEHEFCALRFWKRPVQVRLKDIFDRRWHSRNISIIWIITYSVILLVCALAGFMVRSCLQLLLPQLLVLSSH